MDPKWIEAGGKPKKVRAYDGNEMVWSRLEDKECPKCGDELIEGERIFRCIEKDECGFVISRGRYEEIVANMSGGDIEFDFPYGEP